MFILRWRQLAGVLVGLAVGLGGTAWAGEPTDQVKVALQRLTVIARDPVLQGADRTDERQARAKALILQWFDVPEMARRSLASHWAERSQRERQEFIELFADLLAGTYTQLMVDHLGEQQAGYLSEAVDGSVATVKVQFVSQRHEPTVVAFALLRRQNGWALYDLVIDEVSLLRTYGTRFDKMIRAQSYEALVKAMRLKHESEAALYSRPASVIADPQQASSTLADGKGPAASPVR